MLFSSPDSHHNTEPPSPRLLLVVTTTAEILKESRGQHPKAIFFSLAQSNDHSIHRTRNHQRSGTAGCCWWLLGMQIVGREAPRNMGRYKRLNIISIGLWLTITRPRFGGAFSWHDLSSNKRGTLSADAHAPMDQQLFWLAFLVNAKRP